MCCAAAPRCLTFASVTDSYLNLIDAYFNIGPEQYFDCPSFYGMQTREKVVM